MSMRPDGAKSTDSEMIRIKSATSERGLEPLLPSPRSPHGEATPAFTWMGWISSPAFKAGVRRMLKVAMWVLFLAWVAAWLVLPTPWFKEDLQTKINTRLEHFEASIPQGVSLLLFVAPIFCITMLAPAYLYLPRPPHKSKGWVRTLLDSLALNRTAVVRSPLRTLTRGEFMCIGLFLLYQIWYSANILRPKMHNDTPFLKIWKHINKLLGNLSLQCLVFHFVPVSRGSPFLRLLNLPFERAIKYHSWIGNYFVAILFCHGFGYMSVWTLEGTLLQKALTWKQFGIANLPGAIALSFVLVMWITSRKYIRTKHFELFFYSHQMYIAVIIAVAMHVGDKFITYILPGLILYANDYLLRLLQSWQSGHSLRTRVLPNGTLQLSIPKSPGLQYGVLSTIFLRISSASSIQWHPFSVASSSFDRPAMVTVFIKPTGDWTRKLVQIAQKSGGGRCPFQSGITVEGPYGPQANHFLRYQALVLVAGGIGITPLMAVLRDLLHRHRLGESDLPTDVTLIWAVQKSSDLAILSTLSPSAICPEYATLLRLTAQVYVTREQALGSLQNGHASHSASSGPPTSTHNPESQLPEFEYPLQSKTHAPLLPVPGRGSDPASETFVLCMSFFGVILTWTQSLRSLYPGEHRIGELIPWWIRGLVLCFSILAGVATFGGFGLAAVLFYSEMRGRRSLRRTGVAKQKDWFLSRVGWGGEEDLEGRAPFLVGEERERASSPRVSGGSVYSASELEEEVFWDGTPRGGRLVDMCAVKYGKRPDLEKLLAEVAGRIGATTAGVLVSGPAALQLHAADHCFNFKSDSNTTFEFHSTSFQL